MRRIGVLMQFDENDPEGKRRYSAFSQALADLGWTNLRMDLRWAGGDINRARALHPPHAMSSTATQGIRRPGGAIESAFIRHVG